MASQNHGQVRTGEDMGKLQCRANFIWLVMLAWCGFANAETLGSSMGIYSYPMQGQSPEQQSRDDYECFTFAKSQTGYDPMNPPQVVAQAPQQGADGSRVAGAARGAVAGAVVGEIAGNDAGKGAAVGATLGAFSGGRQSRQRRQQQAQQADAAAQQQAAGMQNSFRNAYGACIEARGYSAKY
jgi:hypothetical protein